MKNSLSCFFRTVLFSIFLFASASSSAQLIPYYNFVDDFTSYSAISGGTVLGSGTSLNNQSYALTLPFTFNLDNTNYSNVYVSANGYISFGTTDPGTGYNMIQSVNTGFRIVSGFDADLCGLDATSEISYTSTGSSPNRVFVAQWKNMRHTAISVLTANFQIQLYETSNAAKIVYGNTVMGGASAFSVQVGLRGSSNVTFFDRSSPSSSWSSTTSGTQNNSNIYYQSGNDPSPGLRYTFTPPICTSPTAPSGLILTPSTTSISGSFTASLADKYLVIRTPAVPLNSTPVNGATYSAGNTLGNGTIVYSGPLTTFNSSGLTQNTTYTYTIFAFNDQNCLGGPVYNVSSPLSGTATTLGPHAYTWIPTTGSSDYASPANWSPQRNSSNQGDTLLFNNGGTFTVTNVQSQNVALVLFSNGTNALFTSSANRTLTINEKLDMPFGTSLSLGGSFVLTLSFSSGILKTSNIGGTLLVGGNCIYNGTNANTKVYGTMQLDNQGGITNSCGCSPSNLIFYNGSFYRHNRNGGTIPNATYNTSSTLWITGTIDTVPAITNGLKTGNLTWECNSQSNSITVSGTLDTIRGNLSIMNTNSHPLFLTPSASSTVFVSGNFIQQGGFFQLNTNRRLQVFGDVQLHSGTLDLNTSSGNIRTLNVLGDLIQYAGHLITKSGSGNPIIYFQGSQHQNATINGTVTTLPINVSLNNFAGATLTGTFPINTGAIDSVKAGSWDGSGSFAYASTGSYLVFTGLVNHQASDIEWPLTAGPANVTIDLSGAQHDNILTMPGSRAITGTLLMTTGMISLGASDLVLENNSTLTGSGAFIAADSTGLFVRYIKVIPTASGATSYLFPVGDLSGTIDYSPLTLLMVTNSQARYIGVRVTNATHPSNGSPADYLTRYWTTTDDGGAAPCSYTMLWRHPMTDISGTENLSLNRWNGSTWTPYPSYAYPSTNNSGIIQVTDTLNSATFPIGNAQWTGRTALHTIYNWTGVVDMNYQVPGNWNPSRDNPAPSDILQFNSGNVDTVKNIPNDDVVSRMLFTNNTTTIMQAATSGATQKLTINSDFDPSTNELQIDAGSSLLITGSTYPLRLNFNGSIGSIINCTASILGRLEIANNSVVTNYMELIGCNATVGVGGVIAASGINTGTFYSNSANTLFVYGSFEYLYSTVTGNIPAAHWMNGSTLTILGVTTATGISFGTTPFYNLLYNCPLQTSVVSNAGNVPEIKGTLEIVSTGVSGQWKPGNASSFTFLIKNYLQTGGTIDFASVNSSGVQSINVSGTFSQNGGTLLASATGASKPTLNFIGTTVVQAVNFNNQSPAGQITYQISNPSGINLTGSGTLTSTFAINYAGGIQVSVPALVPLISTLTLDYNQTWSTVTYDWQGNYSAENVIFPVVNPPTGLTINTGTGNTLSLPSDRTVSGTLTMTSGNIGLGSHTLTIGTSASSPGTISWVSGDVLVGSGALVRWFSTSGLPISPGTATGFFPIGINGSNRFVSLYFTTSTALSAGGTISLSHQNNMGMTNGLSIVDGSYTIDTRTNASWFLTPGNGISLSASTIGMQLTAAGLCTVSNVADLRLCHANSVTGTYMAGSGTAPDIKAQRSGLTLTDFTDGPFYIGSSGANLGSIFMTIADGNWNTGTTWNMGTAPGPTDIAFISPGDTVMVSSAATAKVLTVGVNGALFVNSSSIALDSAITANGTVSVSGGTITLGPAGGGKSLFTLNSGSALNVVSGNLNINGNLSIQTGASLNQIGGMITIDGNASGVVANSVNNADLFYANSNCTLNLSGGSIVITDPNVNTGYYALRINGNISTITTAHTFVFGDGVSTTTGQDFLVFAGSPIFGNMEHYGTPGTPQRRLVPQADLYLDGDLTLYNNGGAIVSSYPLHLNGNLTANAGTTCTIGTIYFERDSSGLMVASTNNQVVSGSGTFINGAGTANFQNLSIKNSSATGVLFNMGDFSFSSTLTFLRGNLNTGTNTVTKNTGASIIGAAQNTGWIAGRYSQPDSTSTSLNLTYEVGDQLNYTPITLSGPLGTVNSSGYIRVESKSGDHPQIGSSGINSLKSLNQYFVVDTIGNVSLTNGQVTFSASWPFALKDAAADAYQFTAAGRNGSNWNALTTGQVSNTYAQIIGLGNNIQSNFQFGEPTGLPMIVQQPITQSICAGLDIAFSVSASGATNYQWQVNSGSGYNNITSAPIYSGINSPTLQIFSVPIGMNAYLYRCQIGNSNGSTPSAGVVLQVSNSQAPYNSIAISTGTTICSGTSVTFTASAGNGGISPQFSWYVNGTIAGPNDSIFTTTSLANNDTVKCVLTSSLSCASPATAISNSFLMTVNQTTSPSVSISASPGNSVCSGSNVTFTALALNSGSAPVYQWYKNGFPVGISSSTYSNSGLINNDQIYCEVTSNYSCSSTPTGTSNIITMNMIAPVTPSISIAASPGNSICSGSTVTLTASPTNGGLTPSYTWKLNGVTAGTDSVQFTPSLLNNGDSVSCLLFSNNGCVTSPNASSNTVHITVNPILPVSVSIVASPDTIICAGTSITFTATPVNGGTTPVYTWKVNGFTVGTNSITYTSSTWNNNDQVTCILTGNALCPSSTSVTSNLITITVNPVVTPSISISSGTGNSVCAGANATFTAVPTNGGASPSYQWKINGVNVGVNSTMFSSSTLSNGDVVTCTLTGSAPCATISTATSNSINMTVNPTVTPSCVITANPGTTICDGAIVSFNAVPTNCGITPGYNWMLNGSLTGTGSNSVSSSTLGTGDQVAVQVSSGNVCSVPMTVVSNTLVMTILPNGDPSVTISVSPGTNIVYGQTVTFTATPVLGGSNPQYQWTLNSSYVGFNSNTYTNNSLQEGDVVDVQLNSNYLCTQNPYAWSNDITMSVVMGENELEQSIQNVVLFPNPGNGIINVRGTLAQHSPGKEVQLELMNTLGQVIYSENFIPENRFIEKQISLPSSVGSGYFLLRLHYDGGVVNRRVGVLR